MTADHFRQRRPNRRFRRLFPAAVAAVTLAASAPLAHPAGSHAATQHKAHFSPPPGKIPTLPRAATTRGELPQATTTT